MDRESRLQAMYAAFNARDIDAVLANMSRDVDWPNAWEGGRVRGWRRQWAVIDAVVHPVAYTTRADGSVEVEVTQLVRDLDGAIVSEGRVLHVYRFEAELITQMDVEETASPA